MRAMGYAPFDRGPLPVGVRSLELEDPARNGRRLGVEIWYPAAARHAGEDLAAATRDVYRIGPTFPSSTQAAVRDAEPAGGRYPLLAFSHGFAGHRRQSTFLCTHLASHGFVVAAVDHTGNTMVDLVMAIGGGGAGATLPEIVEARPRDLIFMVDRLLAGAGDGLTDRIAADRIGALGHSYGGWTALVVTGRDHRIRAAVALAPAGGTSPFPDGGLLAAALDPRWGRDVPALMVVADADSVLPLPGMSEVYDRIPSTKRLVVLEEVDHFHFVDRPEEVHEFMRLVAFPPFDRISVTMRPISELRSGSAAHAGLGALTLAHMEAVLKDSAEAARFLDRDAPDLLAAHGLPVTLPSPASIASR
jgi:predicted dienelactone hydrolase